MDDLLGWGLEGSELNSLQAVVRTVIAWIVSLALLRVGMRRSFDRPSAIDVVVGIVLGSVISRAVNGSARLAPTIAASAALVALHWVLAMASVRSHRFSQLVKGRPVVVVEDGVIREEALASAGYTHDDLHENMRLHGRVAEVSDVALATVERSGAISVIPRREPGSG